MDRSYPYSRRLFSRSRQRKRVAMVAAAGFACVTGLFMLTESSDPITAAVHQAASPLLPAAVTEAVHKVRRIYPYSVIPGGASSQAELKRVVRTDSVVASHYATFDVDKAHPVVVDKPRSVYVSYRKGDKVFWTAHKVALAEGETLLSDGRNEMRARCANRISEVAQFPVEARQPAMEELDDAVELDEGEQVALGPDGLPVSAAGLGGIERHAGQRSLGGGSNGLNGLNGLDGADTMLASSTSVPGTGMNMAMGMSGSGSSMGSRARPASMPAQSTDTTAQVEPAAPAASDSGSASGSQPTAGSFDPLPVTDTGQPATPSLPGTDLPPAAAPSTGAGPGTTPIPGTGTGTNAPPVFIPEPLRPGGQQSGAGGNDVAPPLLPGAPSPAGPLFPQPGKETEPLIPKPELTPSAPQESVEEPEAPANVPEPASIWLFGGALAALLVLPRRRRVSRES